MPTLIYSKPKLQAYNSRFISILAVNWNPMLPGKRVIVDVDQANKSPGINAPQTCEQQQWVHENICFLDFYNNRVIKEGVALQEWRAF